MRVLIAYYSLTGHTAKAAETISRVFSEHDVKMEKLELVKPYSLAKAYTFGCAKAITGGRDEVKSAEFDWSPYDLIVLGSPVWASHPVPAIRDYLARVEGSEGKKVFCFATHAGMAGGTAGLIQKLVEEKDAMFLDFGEVRVKKDWGQAEEASAEKMAKEFKEVFDTMPKGKASDAKSIRRL